MTQLGVNLQRTFVLGDDAEYPADSGAVYEGSAAGLNAGYARQLVAGDRFVGFVKRGCAANAGSGVEKVLVRRRGRVILPVASIAITDVHDPVYASDGNTFVMTASTNTLIGHVVRFVSTGIAEVEFNAEAAVEYYGADSIHGGADTVFVD